MTLFKKSLLAVLAGFAVSIATAGAVPIELLGSWKSIDANNGALSGTIEFNPNSVILKATGHEVLQASWENPSDGKLVFTIENIGSTELSYTLKKEKLTLTYDNGNTQTFTRLLPKAKGKKK